MIISAKLYVLTKEEGGRMSPVFRNYRANLWIPGAPASSDCFLLMDHEMLTGGQEYTDIKFKFLHPEYVINFIKIGVAFDVREGIRYVAKGIITEIVI